MGKPIAGRGQYPFQINGILVDGAKINGTTFVKNLFIYKQRSYNMYDLIDASGKVYEFIEITWRRENTINLKYSDNSEYSVQFIKDNSFFIKTQDIDRNIYGFITLLQENKLKVSTGDYIFYNGNEDYSLLAVKASPSSVTAAVDDIIDLNILFEPIDYSHTAGEWFVDDMIEEVVKTKSSSSQFKCLSEGHSVIRFVPDANPKLVTTTQVFIEQKNATIPLNSFIVMKNDPTDTSGYNGVTVYVGQEITYTAIFTPEEYVPTEALELSYNNNIFEFIGTDDFINYKFKVKSVGTNTTKITMTSGILSASINLTVRDASSDGNIMIDGPSVARVGTTSKFTMSIYNYTEQDVTWHVSDESIATIDQDGVVTPIKTGSVSVYVLVDGFSGNVFKKTLTIYANIPDYIKFKNVTKFAYKPGDSIQLEVEYVPNTVTNTGYWNAVNTEFYTLTSGGLLTILKAVDGVDLSFYQIVYNTLGTGTYGSVTLQNNGAILGFGIVSDYNKLPFSNITAFSFNDTKYVPVGGYSKTDLTFLPLQTTIESRNCTITVEDETIAKVQFIPEDTNTYRFPSIEVYGLKRGITNVTITPTSNSTKSLTVQITVY